MKNSVSVLFFCLFMGSSIICPAKAEPDKWRGYLMDRQCADSIRQDSDPIMFIKHHTKDCALMPNCRRKGYSLYVPDGKWYELDKKGNELAVKILTASKKKSGFYVRVTAVAQGKLLKVESMKESAESNNSAEKRRHGTD